MPRHFTFHLLIFFLAFFLLVVTEENSIGKSDNSDEKEEVDQGYWNVTDTGQSRLRIKASTVISLYYLLPTITDKDDPRIDQNNQPEFNLRNAYIRFNSDIGGGAFVLMSLGGRRVGFLDINDDGDNDDPTYGQLSVVLDRASLYYFAHDAIKIEAGVIRLPWSFTSEDTWGFSIAASGAPRRYGMVEDSDLGVGLMGEFPLRIGSYHFAVYNGEKNVHPEGTSHKATSLKLSFRPLYHAGAYFKSLMVSGFGEYRKVNDPPGDKIDTRVSWATLIFYGIAPVGFGVEWMTAHNFFDESRRPRVAGIGSAFMTVETSWWSNIFIRADVRDPDLSQKHSRKSTRKSFITQKYLRTDDDGRLYIMAGARFLLDGRISISPWVEGIFYQEVYHGKNIAPSVKVNTSLSLRF